MENGICIPHSPTRSTSPSQVSEDSGLVDKSKNTHNSTLSEILTMSTMLIDSTDAEYQRDAMGQAGAGTFSEGTLEQDVEMAVEVPKVEPEVEPMEEPIYDSDGEAIDLDKCIVVDHQLDQGK
jgi:hypothetical protein